MRKFFEYSYYLFMRKNKNLHAFFTLHYNAKLNSSRTGPLIAMVTYRKYAVSKVHRDWSKCLNWYVGVGDEYCRST